MSISRKSEERKKKNQRIRRRWETGESNLQKSALWIKKKTGWSGKSKGIISKAIGKFGQNVKKKQNKVTGKQRAQNMAKDRIAAGKTIAQAEAERDAKMKKALKERHASWKKARKEGKLKEWEKKNKKENKFSRAWD